MFRTYGKLVGLAALFALLFGCAPGARLELQLFYPYTPDSAQLFNKIESYSVRLSGSSLLKSEGDTYPLSPGVGSIPLSNVKCKEGKTSRFDFLRIEVFAKDGSDRVVAYGAQELARPCEKGDPVQIVLAEVESFSALSRLDSDKVSQPSNLKEVRAGHRATPLPDGRLLITGGARMDGPGVITQVSKKTEIYDPATGLFIPGPDMTEERAFHSATLVGTKVIVTGGVKLQDGSMVALKSVDIFELNTEGKLVRSGAPELKEARAFHSSTVTLNSNLLLLGGFQVQSGKYILSTQWEVIANDGNPVSSGQLDAKYQRAWHASVRTVDSSIVLLGGMGLTSNGEFKALKSVLRATLSDGDKIINFSEDTPLKKARAALTATKVAGDKYIMIVGGMVPAAKNMFLPYSVEKNVELLNGLGKLQTSFSYDLVEGRVFHSTNLLADGRVVIFGGLKSSSAMATRTELLTFNPDKPNAVQGTRVTQRKDRFFSTGTILLNNSLLILGGATIDTANQKYVTLFRGEFFTSRPPADSN